MIDKDLYLKTINTNLDRVDSNNWDKSFIERCIKEHSANVRKRNKQIKELRCFKCDYRVIAGYELDRDLSKAFARYYREYIKYGTFDKQRLTVELHDLYLRYLDIRYGK